MLKVGLTGGIGSGKSVVAKQFKELGITVVDADVVSRRFTAKQSPLLQNIAQHFGKQILSANGELDRRQLRTVIFNNPNERKWLEELLHPPIRQEIIQQLNSAEGSYSILESPLLFETHQDELVNKTIVVDIPEELQLERASLRDSSDPESIKKIINSQMPREQRLAKADFAIDNSGTIEHTKELVEKLHHQLLRLI